MSAPNPTYLYHCPYGYYFRLRVLLASFTEAAT